MAESQPERKRTEFVKSSRHVVTFTVNDLGEKLEQFSRCKSGKVSADILYGPEKTTKLTIKMYSTAPRLLKFGFCLEIKKSFFSVKVTNSILDSNNKAECSNKTTVIPKDDSSATFYYGMIVTNFKNDIDRIFPNDTLTILCEIEIFYKFSFQNRGGRTMYYVSTLNASITFLEKRTKLIKKDNLGHWDTRVLGNGGDMLVHEEMLSFYSTVFSSMLDCENRQGGIKKVSIKDIDKDVLGELLDYLYSEQILNKSIDFIAELFSAANKYEVFDLKRHCSLILSLNLDLDNVGKFAKLAEENEDDKLLAVAKTFASEKIVS